MKLIRFVDLLAGISELRSKFENAFHTIGLEAKAVLSAEIEKEKIIVTREDEQGSIVRNELQYVDADTLPHFDFLLATFPYNVMQKYEGHAIDHLNEVLTESVQTLLSEKKPYGFIMERMVDIPNEDAASQLTVVTEEISDFIQYFQTLGYKLSWRLLDNHLPDRTGKRVFILGTLGSKTVLSNFTNEKQKNMMQQLFQYEEESASEEVHIESSAEVAKVQKELFSILLEESRKKDVASPVVEKEKDKEVFFKLYPPKKLIEITKEDGSVTGLVHSYIFQEVFEETMKELDFTRNLNSDLQALFASSNEQILVIDADGKILRVSKAFFSTFWGVENKEDIIGKNIQSFVQSGHFQPDVFRLCVKKHEKVTAIQESNDVRIWSVATPVYTNDLLERVVILSKEISADHVRKAELEVSTQMEEEQQLIYRSSQIEMIVRRIARAAKMNSTILIEGETGVGKEKFAHKVHELSSRNHQPLIRINCGAIPEQLMESELFGYEKGAFTGADKNGKIGYFELADQGTIFLDEIGELPLNMQVKLLRVLQEREITRIGGTSPVSIDVRIIAATNRNLQEMVEAGEFREDLYYRLNVIPMQIPSLRERREDVFPLAVYFLEQQKHMYNIDKSFTPEAIEVLETYDWPGNIRELQNIIERLLIYNDEALIQRDDVLMTLYGHEKAAAQGVVVKGLMPLKDAIKEVEQQLIKLGLQEYKTAAELSKVLDVSPATLSRRMKEMKV